MTSEQIVAVLTAADLAISKRQGGAAHAPPSWTCSRQEEAAFSAGLRASPWVSVNDTGARHAGKACYTITVGSDRFTAFRTGPSKSRPHVLAQSFGRDGPLWVERSGGGLYARGRIWRTASSMR